MATPLFLCDLQGGIGNQLFQIATIHGLAKEMGGDYSIIDQQFSGGGQCSHPSKYYDTIYRRVPRITSVPAPVLLYTERQWTHYDVASEIRHRSNGHAACLLKGYFQSDRYFRDASDIKALFTPEEGIPAFLRKNAALFAKYPDLFSEHDHCFIGVRRGDYVAKAEFHNPCGIEYYRNAMNLVPATRYYIASDDLAWCREHFVGDQFVFFDMDDDLEQLYMGCLFKNYIIGNSTYHWWMSFLSVHEDPTIIAPDKWVFGPKVRWDEYATIYRKGMVVLERATV